MGTAAVGLGASIGFLHGYLATPLRNDLGISRGAVGLLVSAYFGSTGVGSVAGGILTDRLGARLAVATDLVVVAAAAVLIVVWPSYPALLIASVAAGAAYALANAGTNVAIGAAVPARSRGIALTVKTGGVPAMATLAALLAPWAALRFGWSGVFALVALLAAAAAVAAVRVLPPDRPDRTAARPGALPEGFLWFPVAAFLLICGSQPLFSWSVSWFEEATGTSVSVAGVLSAVATATGLVAMIVIARRSDHLGAGRRLHVIVAMVLTCAGATALAATGATTGPVVGVVALAVAMGTQLGAIGVMHAAVVDAVPQAVGRASGVTMTGYYLGALVSPAAFGALVDVTGGYGTPWLACTASLLLATVAFRRAGQQVRAVGLEEVVA